ncbi:uncharacterized protein LOC111618910 [Centruroides sculpturatus]|uniref:uncharacterized protein LOC111618910 n=1 Tax=Centruroides sculpturatus TaxID=218467 RepID=UPI000C6EFE71|nr:uncharacterized protein LOC111618910 [Centruroides sculpturatus]
MLTHKEGKKRPASSNPKLPSIHSPVLVENGSDDLSKQITFVPVKIPTTKWQDRWPPPLNLSPLNQRRNSDTGNFPVIPKKENKSDNNQNKSEIDILTKRKSSSAKCSMGKCENVSKIYLYYYRFLLSFKLILFIMYVLF